MDASSSSSSAGAGGAQAAWQHFQQQRLEDLHAAYALAQQALLTQRLPKDVPPNVAYTAMGAVALSGLLLVSLHPKGRRLALDVGETVLATILVLLLLVIVLGLPFGEWIHTDAAHGVAFHVMAPGHLQWMGSAESLGATCSAQMQPLMHATHCAGAIFIAYKGIAFVITSLLQYYPQAQEALDGLNMTVRASWG